MGAQVSHVSRNDPDQDGPWYDDFELESMTCTICGDEVLLTDLVSRKPAICWACADEVGDELEDKS
jgi:hypothetical protein